MINRSSVCYTLINSFFIYYIFIAFKFFKLEYITSLSLPVGYTAPFYPLYYVWCDFAMHSIDFVN